MKTKKVKVIIIGYGNVGPMHARIFAKLGVEIYMVVDPNPAKREKAEEDGYGAVSNAVSNIGEITEALEDIFWDICVPDDLHLGVLQEILARDNRANVLMEKPICMPSQVGEMMALLENYPEAKICVEETYLASAVLLAINEMARKYEFTKPDIYTEQTKNRIEDIEKGRFIDPELMIFGLEAPHSLTLVAGTGPGRRPGKITGVKLEDMILPDGRVLRGQGLGRVDFFTEDGCRVVLYTSMMGEINRSLSEIDVPSNIPYRDSRRYRILVLEEGDIMIIGQFEPIPGWERFKGRVLVFKNGQKVEGIIVEDNPMTILLKWSVEFFRGERENPSPPKTAISLVDFLGKAVKRGEGK